MYNTETPARAELPSSRQLLRSTVLAAISAVVLLTAVVLPAEYGIDPTGVGSLLRLTEMGTIKNRLASEAAADAAAGSTSAAPVAAASAEPAPPAVAEAITPPPAEAAPSKASEAAAWRDEISFTLAPGQGTEVKLRMKQGETAFYAWSVDGGVVNYDTHGDGSGRSISYVKGRGVAADDGELVAAFTGNHGWFWRNRGQADVKLTLRARGAYVDMKRVK